MSTVLEGKARGLPNGWRWASMGDIAEIIGGGTPRTTEPANFEGGDIPWITPADLSGYTEKYISHGSRFVTRRGLESSAARLLPAGTVLFSSRAPIGYVAIARNPLATNQGFKSFVLKDSVLPEYVYWWLKGSKQRAEGLASGTTFLEISGANAKKIPIPIAPLEQQREIVAEIEKQFSRFGEALSSMMRVRANLKRYKASIFEAAVRGRLVTTEKELSRRQGQTYESGKQLLDRIRRERRAVWQERNAGSRKKKYVEPLPSDESVLPELPEGWTWATWDQIGLSQNGRAFPSADYCETGVKLLRPGNLHEDGRLVWTSQNTRHMPERYEQENADLIVRGRELVMNLTAQSLKDEFLGRICLTGIDEHCLLNQRLARLSPVLILPEFALVVFKSSWFRRFVDELNTGSLIQHMFTSQIAGFAFPLPPLAEQQRIVAEVGRCLSVVQRLDAEILANLSRVEVLKDSVLSLAFKVNMGGDR